MLATNFSFAFLIESTALELEDECEKPSNAAFIVSLVWTANFANSLSSAVEFAVAIITETAPALAAARAKEAEYEALGQLLVLILSKPSEIEPYDQIATAHEIIVRLAKAKK
jgi:hypothetical protein